MGENETRFLSLSGQGFQLIRGTVMAEKKEFIRIRGARENNLKALNVDIPRNQFVVFTGLSGSGKSFSAKEEIVDLALSTDCLLYTSDAADE